MKLADLRALVGAMTADVPFDVGERRADITRREAATHGWVHGLIPPAPHRGGQARSLDYCPEHADDLPDDAVPRTLPMHARPS